MGVPCWNCYPSYSRTIRKKSTMTKFKMWTDVNTFDGMGLWYSESAGKWMTRDDCKATGGSFSSCAEFRRMADAEKNAKQLIALGCKDIVLTRWFKHNGVRYCEDWEYIK